MKKTQQVKTVAVSTLKPHPKNEEMYGKQHHVSDLVQSITDFGGILEPIHITKGKVIISGHRRYLAAKQVGLKQVPCIVVDGLANEEDEVRAILLANQYRQKTNEQKIREGLAWFDMVSEKADARAKGGKKLSANPMANLPSGNVGSKGTTRDKIALLTSIGAGRNFDKGKKAVSLIDTLTAQEKLLAAEGVRRELNQSFDAGLKAVKRHRTAPAETLKLLELIGCGKAKNYNDAFGKKLLLDMNHIPKGLPRATNRYNVYRGDILKVGTRIRKFLLSAKNLLIIVDIPYVSKEYGDGSGDNWEGAAKKVAEFAATYLPMHGSLLVMTGQYWLPGVLDALCRRPELSYYWTYCVYMPGASRRPAKRNVVPQWKPILHFVKGEASDGNGSLVRSRIISDVIRSQPLGPNERLHDWQQPKVAFQVVIEALTDPGSVICDPMMGSGTTGVVAIEKKRRFIGIEIDEVTFRIAQKRLLDTARILEATEKKRRGRKGRKCGRAAMQAASGQSKNRSPQKT